MLMQGMILFFYRFAVDYILRIKMHRCYNRCAEKVSYHHCSSGSIQISIKTSKQDITQSKAEITGRLEVLSKSLIWLTTPMQQHSKSEAIGLVPLLAPVKIDNAAMRNLTQ